MALSSRTITASINYRCAPFSATLMHRGRRAALKTPSDACAEDCRGKLIWPRCPINACSPWCVPIITLPESVLTTKPRQRFSAVTCCTSNVNPPPLYSLHEELDVAWCFHEGTGAWYSHMNVLYGENRFYRHVASHWIEMQLALIAMIIGGVFEFHPRLRVGFLEAQNSWAPGVLSRIEWDYPQYRESH